MISWLPFPLESLNFAEAFYIGILRPERNLGYNTALRIRDNLVLGRPEGHAYEQLETRVAQEAK